MLPVDYGEEEMENELQEEDQDSKKKTKRLSPTKNTKQAKAGNKKTSEDHKSQKSGIQKGKLGAKVLKANEDTMFENMELTLDLRTNENFEERRNRRLERSLDQIEKMKKIEDMDLSRSSYKSRTTKKNIEKEVYFL